MTNTEYKLDGKAISYEVNETGYFLYLDGVKWIGQNKFIPYQKDTLEESAIAHIEAIIEENGGTTDESLIERIGKLESIYTPTIDKESCTLEEFMEYKKKILGNECTNTIYAGTDVTLSDGNTFVHNSGFLASFVSRESALSCGETLIRNMQ